MDKVRETILNQLMQADELGVRLEIVGGLPLWEASPVLRHQEAIDRIRASIKKRKMTDGGEISCDCYHASNVTVSFPDGSIKQS
jgi:hypothetical protein